MGHNPFKNFGLSIRISVKMDEEYHKSRVLIPTVVSVLLWVCVVVQWAVLWDQWNAL